ncbi:MAG: hypothetical protein RLZZ334_911 [Actinomycetota bacterium]
MAVGFGIVMPAIPVFAKSFGVNNAAIGLMVSAFAITRFASGLISGTLVDKFGERKVFSTGVFMVSLFTFLAGVAQSYEQLLFFRAAGGLGSSMFSVAASSVILRSVSDDQRGHAQSVYQGSFIVGGMAGPAIGGLLSVISLRAPFFVYSVLLMCSGIVALFFLKGDSIGAKVKNSNAEPATTIRNSTTAVVGYGFAISAVVQGLILMKAGRFSDAKGRRAASIIGANIVFVGVLVLTFAVNAWMFLLSMIILGFGGAFLSTTPASIVGDIIKGKGGKVIAIFQMAGDAGMIFGPIIIGWISDIYSYRTAFGASAVIFTVVLFLVYRIPETRNVEGPQVNNLKPLDEDL